MTSLKKIIKDYANTEDLEYKLRGIRRKDPYSSRKNRRKFAYSSKEYEALLNPRILLKPNSQRVIVKNRFINQNFNSETNLKFQIKYLALKGKGENEEKAKFYSKSTITEEELKEKANIWKEDKRIFKFIISPENGHKFNSDREINQFIRKLVSNMEKDLKTKLEWMAVNHYDTGKPHTHIILRGKRANGADLIINSDYISNGIRARASQILTKKLGLRKEKEIKLAIQKNIKFEGITKFDFQLQSTLKSNNYINFSKIKFSKNFIIRNTQKKQLIERLLFLRSINLAEKQSLYGWKVKPNFINELKALSNKNDIIKTLHKSMKEGELSNNKIYDKFSNTSISGILEKKGIENEHFNSKFLIIKTLTGERQYVPLGNYDNKRFQALQTNSFVDLKTISFEININEIDKKIVKIAKSNNNLISKEYISELIVNKKLSTTDAYNIIRKLSSIKSKFLVTKNENDEFSINAPYIDKVRKGEPSIVFSPAFIINTRSKYLNGSLIKQKKKNILDLYLATYNDTIKPRAVSQALGAKFLILLKERLDYLESNKIISKDVYLVLKQNLNGERQNKTIDLNFTENNIATVRGLVTYSGTNYANKDELIVIIEGTDGKKYSFKSNKISKEKIAELNIGDSVSVDINQNKDLSFADRVIRNIIKDKTSINISDFKTYIDDNYFDSDNVLFKKIEKKLEYYEKTNLLIKFEKDNYLIDPEFNQNVEVKKFNYVDFSILSSKSMLSELNKDQFNWFDELILSPDDEIREDSPYTDNLKNFLNDRHKALLSDNSTICSSSFKDNPSLDKTKSGSRLGLVLGKETYNKNTYFFIHTSANTIETVKVGNFSNTPEHKISIGSLILVSRNKSSTIKKADLNIAKKVSNKQLNDNMIQTLINSDEEIEVNVGKRLQTRLKTLKKWKLADFKDNIWHFKNNDFVDTLKSDFQLTDKTYENITLISPDFFKIKNSINTIEPSVIEEHFKKIKPYLSKEDINNSSFNSELTNLVNERFNYLNDNQGLNSKIIHSEFKKDVFTRLKAKKINKLISKAKENKNRHQALIGEQYLVSKSWIGSKHYGVFYNNKNYQVLELEKDLESGKSYNLEITRNKTAKLKTTTLQKERKRV